MIWIDNSEIYGWEAAILGMRNSWNSWDKSDSSFINTGYITEYSIGNNDISLMKKLIKAGSDHRKFMRFINVTCDIVAPMYWWAEYDTYKIGTVRNSCSTMHTITDKEFTSDDFSHEHLENPMEFVNACRCLDYILYSLNGLREKYLETKDKKYWWEIIQILPSSYNQKSTVQLNYEVLKAMYHARKNHKLDEWREFCKWIETLPYSELITEA